LTAVGPKKLKGQVRALIPMLISQTDKPMTSIFERVFRWPLLVHAIRSSNRSNCG
jgi:hypothetical protein